VKGGPWLDRVCTDAQPRAAAFHVFLELRCIRATLQDVKKNQNAFFD
jgi:hypothetical protein